MSDPYGAISTVAPTGSSPYDAISIPANENAKPAPPAPAKPAPNTYADILKSAATGLGKGVAAIIGLPGDASALLDSGANAIRNWISPGAKPLSATAHSIVAPPTSDQVNKSIQAVTGGYHQPETTAGKYAESIASFAPGAALPGGLAARAARMVVPGAASEAAGEATAGTSLEPYARTLGALAGGATTGIGEAAAAAGRATPGVMTTQALKNAAHEQYANSEGAGLIVKGDSFQNSAAGLQSKLADAGMDQTLHPKATAVYNNIAKTDQNVTLKGIDVLRQQAGDAAASADPAERRLGRIIKDHIDDYVGNLQPSDVVQGDAQGASDAITSARDLWSRASKGEIIDNAIQKATNGQSQFGASGLENSLRTRFRQLANNDRVMRRFAPDEQDAIRQVANGTTVGNALRFLGKFSPHGYLNTMLTGGAAYEAGGPLGAVAALGAGEAGRIGATAITRGNAKYASELVRAGKPTSISATALGKGSPALTNQSGGAIPYAATIGALAAQQSQGN